MRKVRCIVFVSSLFFLGCVTFVQAEVISGLTLNLDGQDWVLATDPENVGRDQG